MRGIAFRPYSGINVLKVNGLTPREKNNVKLGITKSTKFSTEIYISSIVKNSRKLQLEIFKKIKNRCWDMLSVYYNHDGYDELQAIYRLDDDELTYGGIDGGKIGLLSKYMTMPPFERLFFYAVYNDNNVSSLEEILDDLCPVEKNGQSILDLERFRIETKASYGNFIMDYNDESSVLNISLVNYKRRGVRLDECRLNFVGSILDGVLGKVDGIKSKGVTERNELHGLTRKDVKELLEYSNRAYKKMGIK